MANKEFIYIDDIMIDDIVFSPRTTHALKRNGFEKIGELRYMSYNEITNIDGVGIKSADEIWKFFKKLGIKNEWE